MSMARAVYGQFERPRGLLGEVVGRLMALKNDRRGRWVVDLLQLEAGMRVLEVGSGPGVDGARVLGRVGDHGSYIGLDASGVMVRQARPRNRLPVRDGRARVVAGSLADGVAAEPGRFDLVFVCT